MVNYADEHNVIYISPIKTIINLKANVNELISYYRDSMICQQHDISKYNGRVVPSVYQAHCF